MEIRYIANGLGAPSQFMLVLANEGKIDADFSITSDTGSEEDRLCSDGRRMTARAYFDEFTVPLAKSAGVEARFVRTENAKGVAYPPLVQVVRSNARNGERDHGALLTAMPLPLFGSNGGRLVQTCTDKWKIQAIKQTVCRIAGVRTNTRKKGFIAIGAQGIHTSEAWRRVKGADPIEDPRGFMVYKTIERAEKRRRAPGQGILGDFVAIPAPARPSPYLRHFYPLVDLGYDRPDIQLEMERRGIPYLITSECDMCPHKDRARWLRTSIEKIEEVAAIEADLKGEFYFTAKRRPLKDVILEWLGLSEWEPVLVAQLLALECERDIVKDEAGFDCESSVCGV